MITATRRQGQRRAPLGARAAAFSVLLAGLLAGCGSSTNVGAQLTPAIVQQARATPAQSADDQPGGVKAPAIGDPLDKAHSSVVHLARPRPGYRATPSETVKAAGNFVAVQPCTLVSRSAAQAVIGSPVSGVVEAPLGPTCIYSIPHQPPVTLAIQSMGLASASRLMHQRQRVSVAGRTGYCGSLGHQVLFVSANADSVLSIDASCRVAQRLAAKALGNLLQ